MSKHTNQQLATHAEQLQNISQDIIRYAKQLGATDVDITGNAGKGFTVNVHMGSLDTIEHDRSRELAITVYIGKKRGSASTSDFSPQAIKNSVQAAYNFAQYAAEDHFLSLPEQSELISEQAVIPDCDIYHPWDLTPAQAIELALECEAKLLNYDPEYITKTDGATVSTHQGYTYLANSQGLAIGSYASQHEIACMPIATDGEHMERDYEYSQACDPTDLWSLDKIITSATKKTIARLGAKKRNTFKAPVLFIDYPAISLIGSLVSASAGSSIYKKASFLVDKLGQVILPDSMNIIERPHLKKAIGSSAFDGEGVYTRDKYLIKNGVLNTYLMSTYSANQLKARTTGNSGGVHNLIVSSEQAQPVEQIIRSLSKGVIVTGLMGQGVNLVTGDYSRGINGFYVENGEIQYPIHEMTIAGNLADMFKNIVAVGDQVDERSNIRTGALLIDGMTIAG